MALNNPYVIRTFHRAKSRILRVARAISEHRGISLLVILALLVVGVIAPLVGQQEDRRGKRENERDSAALIRKRAEWFFHQRAFPLGHIPAGARLKAIQQMEEMRRMQGTLMDRFAAQARTAGTPEGTIGSLSGTAWTSVGPQPTSSTFFGLTSGRVNAIAVDPCDTTGNTVYIGGAQGGVWKTTDGGTNWTPLTDNQPSLAIGSLVLDSSTSDCISGHTGAIYAGTGEENFSFDSFYGVGVLISQDGGATWTKDTTFAPVTGGIITPQGPQFAGPFIGSLGVSPVASAPASQVLLAAVQSANGSGSGIWRSVNGGSSWTQVPPVSGSNAFGTAVAFDPGDNTGQTAYAALGTPGVFNGIDSSNNGVYKSTNGGQTWTRLQSLDNTANSTLGTGASSAYGRISIALAPSTSSPSPANTEIVVAIADATTTTCGAGLGNSTCLLGTFISTNGGTSFAAVQTNSAGTGFCDQQCFYDMSIGIDPQNPNAIFLGGGPNADGSGSGASSVIFSNSGGASFGDVSFDISTGIPIHVDNHAFAFAHPSGGGTIVYIGDDGGVWSSANVESIPGSQTWNNLNNNLSLTQLYPGNSIHPSNPQLGFAGSQDNGTQKFDPTFNPSNQQEWHDTAACGDGGWTAIDPSTPSTVYAACEAIGNPGTINKNQLDGEPGATFANWIPLDTPAMDADIANFVPPLVLDPLTPQNLYFATCRVWQSINGGISWTDISGGLDGSVAKGSLTTFCPGSLNITTMAVAPTDSSTVYVGTDAGEIFATSTANMGSGATFARIDNSSTPGRVVTQIVGSPASNKVAYLAFSGFSSCGSANGCDGLGHIFKFDGTVGNGTFTNITGNLPDIPVNDIVLDPNDNTNNTIYVATDVGLFGTTTGGSTWLPLATGLPHIECTSLKLDNAARVLIVGTHGRGDWELQLPGLAADALTGISPTSATAGTTGFTLTLNGQGFGTNPAVNFGTTPLTSTGSGAQLTVAVPSSALTSSGVEAVTVAGASGSLNFSIEGPVPNLTGITPTSASSTASAVTITVSGSNFTPNTGLTWTPGLGSSQQGNTTLLAQQPGGTSTSFTVSVPATLLQSTLAHMVPTVPARRPGPGPKYWLLVALFAVVASLFLFTFVPRRRRLIFGTSAATVLVLLLAAGCGGSSTTKPGAVQVAINAYTPATPAAPGGGLSSATASFTVNP